MALSEMVSVWNCKWSSTRKCYSTCIYDDLIISISQPGVGAREVQYTGCIMYADDIALLSSSTGRTELHSLLDMCDSFTRRTS